MYRALLVGVPHYRDDAFPDLPFIDDDLVELAAALTACGYDVESHERGAADGDSIQYAIESFIVTARPGETLLIYLSGHGVHYNGMDYLIPRTAMTSSSRFPENCVRIDCDSYVENSAAKTVIVVFDACREGITLTSKGPGFTEEWGTWQRDKTVAQQVAYFYACSPGQTAGFSRAGFSMLSHALCQALADESEPSTLADLLKTTREKMSALIREHDVRPHQARVRTDIDPAEIVVVPREGPTGEHAWVTAAREHRVWTAVADPRGVEALRDHTTALVRRLTKDISPDPWLDHEAFALLMSRKVQWLVCTVNQDLGLSAADAALLVAFPFVHQAYWARLAADQWPPTDPDFHRFRAGYPRLERRIAGAEAADAQKIERWLFLRWLVARPASYDEARLPPRSDGLAGEVFDPDQLIRMLRALRMDLTLLADLLPAARGVAGSSDDEQKVHAQLLGFLLVAAHRFAIDPLDLPQVIVDHIGTGDPVDLAQLATTLAGATWEIERRSRSLRARCHHQAVHHALKLHAESVNALLVQIERIGPEALADMPSHANAELLEAAVGPDGLPLQIAEGFRFRLAEDQVQELLMGEQLYGDPALAVRELYQNALDACRYRKARTEYLAAERQPVPADWQPKIEFRQGVENGRPYLDCVDNGVGMGLRELTGLFAHAGVRFTTLPEYLEEEALWRRHGITLYPNSRFGIGVLSYFMLADEITVTTCRFRRDGRAGDLLEVHIAGPGTLSRIRPAGQGKEAGTTVRLYLRKEVSCVDILRRILWVSEFDVTATDRTGSISWTAGQLSDNAPLGSDPLVDGAIRTVRDVQPTSLPTLWWCDGTGGILADGLWVGTPIFGAVVDLIGPHIPKLTVDRRRIVEHNKDAVWQQLSATIPDLGIPESTILTHRWWATLADSDPRLADEIYRQRLEVADRPWVVAKHDMDLAVVGFFSADEDMFARDTGTAGASLPENLASWRLRAWVEAGQFPGLTVSSSVMRARPSDIDLVSQQIPTSRDRRWLSQPDGSERDLPVGHVIAVAARTGLDPSEVIGRLSSLGYRTGHLSAAADHLDVHAGVLTSAECDGQYPWLYSDIPVSPGHVVKAALTTGLSVSDVVASLTMLGFDTSQVRTFRGTPDVLDLTMLSVRLKGTNWLPPTEPVPPGHVLAAAKQLGTAPEAVATRLRELGHQVHHAGAWPEPDEITLTVTSLNLDRVFPWLDPTATVSPGHVAAAAAECRCGVAEVLALLQALSFRAPDPNVVTSPLDDHDRTVLEGALLGSRWLDLDQQVPHGHVAWASMKTRLSVVDIVNRLVTYGFQVGDRTRYLSRYSPDDLVLLSRDLDGFRPWRDEPNRLTAEEIIQATLEIRCSASIAARLAQDLSIDAPAPDTMADQFDSDDKTIISADVDGTAPWLDPRNPVPARHIIAVSGEIRRSSHEVTARLRKLGYEPANMPVPWDREDELLLSRALDGKGPWVVGERIPAKHLLRIWHSGRDVVESAKRLVRLGMLLPDGIEFADAT